MKLWQALGICPGDVVAFTGGGGKTSLALRVAQEVAAEGRPVIVTCTTKMYPVVGMRTVYDVAACPGTMPVCLAARFDEASGKLIGVTPEVVLDLKLRLPDAVILVEADGSAGRPLKVPASHEPVIPPCADVVVPVAGASALGCPITPECVHRAPLLAFRAGSEVVTPSLVATALVGPAGCTRGAPVGARVVPVLGQADLPAPLHETAECLLGRGAGRVVLAAPATSQPVRAVAGDVAAIVLAGGASRRFGANKLLSPWGERTLLEAALQAPLRAGLGRVVVVTGAFHSSLAPLLARYPVELVENPAWAEGMSTSLRAGLNAARDCRAAIICLGDQPALPPVVLERLAAAHRESLAPVVAPVCGGARRNPVLFDRSLFPELGEVTGDEGGRAVVARYRDRLVPVDCADESWFADVNVPPGE